MAAEHDMFVRLDMEDHRVTQDTIDVVTDLHSQGLPMLELYYKDGCLELLTYRVIRN